jgi:hypothetical protein
MKLLKRFGLVLCLVVLCLLVAPKTRADEQSSKTVVTFTVAVEVPGLSARTLPAGTYLFKALESSPDRDIIQVSNPDGTQVFTTFLGVPNSRLKAPDLVTVMFTDRPAADPQALKAWYCPGRTWGDQIVYETPRAIQLAKESNQPVLSTSVALATSSVDVLKTAPIQAVSPMGETIAIAQVVDAPQTAAPAVTPTVATETAVEAGPAVAVVPPPAAAPAPNVAPAPVAVMEPPATPTPTVTEPAFAPTPAAAPLPVAVTEPPATPASAVATAAEVATATLPKTASTLPLIGMVGLLMLGAGFLLTGLMKRHA